MKKLKVLMVVAAVFMMAGVAAAQTTLTLNGQIRVYPEMNNYGYGALVIGDQPKTNAFVDQRARLMFNVKSGENVGGNVTFEIDSRWGDNAYTAGVRNQGAALEADSINVETKNAFLWFKPSDKVKLTLGLQGYTDAFQGVLLGGADAAGLRADIAFTKSTNLMVGGFVFQDARTQYNDGVTFFPVSLTQKLGNNTLGFNFYYLNDMSGNAGVEGNTAFGAQTVTGNRNLLTASAPYVMTNYGGSTAPYGFITYAPTYYEKANVYYTGLSFDGSAGPVSYSVWGLYNFGEIKGVPTAFFGNPAAAPTAFNAANMTNIAYRNMTISAWAAQAMVDTKVAKGKVRARVLYSSGSDKLDKYNGVITGNQYALGSDLPLMQDDMFILVRTTQDITHSAALLNDINNQGRGALLGYLTFDQNLTDNFNMQFGYGYLGANKGRVFPGQYPAIAATGAAAAQARIHQLNAFSKEDNTMANEVNMKLTYKFEKNLSIALIGAYAFLGDFYNDAYYYSNGNGTTSYLNGMTQTFNNAMNLFPAGSSTFPNQVQGGMNPDNLWRTSVRFVYAF